MNLWYAQNNGKLKLIYICIYDDYAFYNMSKYSFSLFKCIDCELVIIFPIQR